MRHLDEIWYTHAFSAKCEPDWKNIPKFQILRKKSLIDNISVSSTFLPWKGHIFHTIKTGPFHIRILMTNRCLHRKNVQFFIFDDDNWFVIAMWLKNSYHIGPPYHMKGFSREISSYMARKSNKCGFIWRKQLRDNKINRSSLKSDYASLRFGHLPISVLSSQVRLFIKIMGDFWCIIIKTSDIIELLGVGHLA